MPQQTPDVPQCKLTKTGIIVSRKQGLAASPETLMRVHAAAVVAEQRFGHEGDRLAILIRDIPDDVLVKHHVVGRFHQSVETLINFALTAGGDFVVVAL